MSMSGRVARWFLPRGVRPRKIPFGMAKGATANIDFEFDSAFYFGRHEPDLHAHYRAMLKPGMRVFDVGMYRGWDALGFAHMTGGEVVSFDCNPECLALTRRFLEPSGVKVTLVQGYVSDGSNGEMSLDRAAKEHFEPDFIKLDVEGAEATVLRGALSLLRTKRPKLVIETHGMPAENASIEVLESVGYAPTVVERSRGLFSEARSLEHNRWLICWPPAGS